MKLFIWRYSTALRRVGYGIRSIKLKLSLNYDSTFLTYFFYWLGMVALAMFWAYQTPLKLTINWYVVVPFSFVLYASVILLKGAKEKRDRYKAADKYNLEHDLAEPELVEGPLNKKTTITVVLHRNETAKFNFPLLPDGYSWCITRYNYNGPPAYTNDDGTPLPKPRPYLMILRTLTNGEEREWQAVIPSYDQATEPVEGLTIGNETIEVVEYGTIWVPDSKLVEKSAIKIFKQACGKMWGNNFSYYEAENGFLHRGKETVMATKFMGLYEQV